MACGGPSTPRSRNTLAPTLQVVEQIPGLVMSADATEHLKLGYFPSYNVPWFKEVRWHPT